MLLKQVELRSLLLHSELEKWAFPIDAPICTETKDRNAAANAMPCLESVSIIIFTALGMIEILILYNQYISSISLNKTIK